MPRVAFQMVTPQNLTVDATEVVVEGKTLNLLILAKKLPKHPQCIQIMGTVGKLDNTPTLTWYYEYEPIPKLEMPRVIKAMERLGNLVGTFDQFGNFGAHK